MSLAERIAAIEAALEAWGELPVQGELVSVILPTRDRAGCIGAAIASVAAQTYQDWELIIIDDGSTNPTAEAVAPWLRDRRIRYLPGPARGAAGARNAGLAAARGGLIAYLDSDNEWRPRYLSAMAAAFATGAETAYAALLRDDEETGAEPRHILFTPFDRPALVEANFIDLNVFMHRRELFERLGGFDARLKRMIDWDLILRYTAEAPAMAVPVIGAHYHTQAPGRISARESFPDAFRQIRAKARKFSVPGRPMRVLCAAEPDARGDIDVETESRGMRALGVDVILWREAGPAPGGDLLHVHGLELALRLDARLPMTVRLRPGEAAADRLSALLARREVRAVYADAATVAAFPAFPLHGFGPVFDATRFAPHPEKSPFLVFAAAAPRGRRDFSPFLKISKLLPAHLCVLALLEGGQGACLAELLALRRLLGAPAIILPDLPHAEVAQWMGRAGIYLHPSPDAGMPPGGAPLAIAEAMASGCRIFVPHGPLSAYAAEAGCGFGSAEEAAAGIAAAAACGPRDWARWGQCSTDRAFSRFSGDAEFFMLHEDWAAILRETVTAG